LRPKIISLGFALPPRGYTQEAIRWLLGYNSRKSQRIFANTGIEKRYLWVEPTKKTWQELCEEYERGATELSKRAILSCLDNRPLDSFGCLIFASCTGYSCPGIAHRVASTLGLPDDLYLVNVVGQGCEAAGPALARACDYVRAHHRPAMVVCTEVCSCAYFPSGEDDLENVVVNSLFGDASGAMLVGYDDDPHHPEVLEVLSYFNREYMDYLGFRWVNGRLKCVLDRDVPRASGILVKEAVLRILKKRSLGVADITHWAIHPGGPAVIKAIQKELGLSDAQVESSWNALREVGNTSSATVIIVGKQLSKIEPPAFGIAISMGAGFEVSCALLKW
jgi:predicted naringenin-chalcone synthase